FVEDDLDVEFSGDDDEVFAEDDDEKWDDERWDDEGFGEARRRPKYRRKYNGQRKPVTRRQPVVGVKGASVNTPGGKAHVKFEKPVAAKESVERLEKRLDETIKKVDMEQDKNTKILDTKINSLTAEAKKAQQNGQYGMLLPLLLSKSPEIKELEIGE